MTIISIFHNEGKSQKVLERLASQVLYESKVMENRLESKTLSETQGRVHKQHGSLHPWEDCQEKSIPALQEMDWGWCRCIKGHHAAGKKPQLSHSYYRPTPEWEKTCHTWAKEKNYWTRAQWSKVAIYQEILDHFMLSSAEKLWGCKVLFQQKSPKYYQRVC